MRNEMIIDLAINEHNIYTHAKPRHNIEWADNLRTVSYTHLTLPTILLV